MGRTDDFEAGSAEGTLRDLGYSDEEIGRTAGDPAIAHLGTEERLRVSLRALSAEHSESVHQPFENDRLQRSAADEADQAYNEGRKAGQRDAMKRMSQSEKAAKAKTPRQPKQVDPARQALKTARMLGSLSRKASGRRR